MAFMDLVSGSSPPIKLVRAPNPALTKLPSAASAPMLASFASRAVVLVYSPIALATFFIFSTSMLPDFFVISTMPSKALVSGSLPPTNLVKALKPSPTKLTIEASPPEAALSAIPAITIVYDPIASATFLMLATLIPELASDIFFKLPSILSRTPSPPKILLSPSKADVTKLKTLPIASAPAAPAPNAIALAYSAIASALFFTTSTSIFSAPKAFNLSNIGTAPKSDPIPLKTVSARLPIADNACPAPAAVIAIL